MTNSRNEDPHAVREAQKNPRRTVGVVFLMDSQRRLLLVRTKRLPNQWQPIGGGMKPYDSSIIETVRREVSEEAGIELESSSLERIFETSYDFGDGTVHFFLARLPNTAVLDMDSGEIEAWQWLSLEEAQKLPMFPATEKCMKFMAEETKLFT